MQPTLKSDNFSFVGVDYQTVKEFNQKVYLIVMFDRDIELKDKG